MKPSLVLFFGVHLQGPSTATELLGARKPGEVVQCTGRSFDGWVELHQGWWCFSCLLWLDISIQQASRNASGGWMLVDGARGGKQSLGDGIEICSEDFLR